MVLGTCLSLGVCSTAWAYTTGEDISDELEADLADDGYAELPAGRFEISRAIVPLPRGLDRTLKGDPEGGTVIDIVKPKKKKFGYASPGPYWRSEGWVYSRVFDFNILPPYRSVPHFSVTVADITFNVTSYPDPENPGSFIGPSEPHDNPWLTPARNTAINNVVFVEGGNFSTYFKRVTIIGGAGDANGFNLVYPLGTSSGDIGDPGANPPEPPWVGSGTHVVEDCHIANAADAGVEYYRWTNSSFRVTGSTFSNTITTASSSLVGVGFYDLPSSEEITVEDNRFFGGDYVWGAIELWENSSATVSDNSFVDVTGAYGVLTVESDDNEIGENTFENVSTPGSGAIALYGNGNTVERDDFTRSGLHGWATDGQGDVLLWMGTEENFVFESGNFEPGTGGARQHVLDLGVNNTVIGH